MKATLTAMCSQRHTLQVREKRITSNITAFVTVQQDWTRMGIPKGVCAMYNNYVNINALT